MRGNGDRYIEFVVVSRPSEGCSDISQLGSQPVIRLPLAWTIPNREYLNFLPGEVLGMRISCRCRVVAVREAFLGELPDRLKHRESGAA